MSTLIRNLQRRLERAELDNLRAEVARLAQRIDELEADLEYAEARAWSAERSADLWQELAEYEGKQVTLVLDRDGNLRGGDA